MTGSVYAYKQQKGAALVITIIVLLVLTIIGISSTNSNQIQAALVRNNQFRLETFNASYTEIEAQIDKLNLAAASSDAIPILIQALITNHDGVISSEVAGAEIELIASHKEMQQAIEGSYMQDCKASDVDVDKEIEQCHLVQLKSVAKYRHTSTQSTQYQLFKYLVFNHIKPELGDTPTNMAIKTAWWEKEYEN